MKLLTKEIVKKLKKSTYDIIHDKIPNVPIIVKYFSLTGWTWYVYAGDQFQNNETNKSDWHLRAWVEGTENEDGFVLLSELESIRMPGPFDVLGVERDLYFTPCLLSEIPSYQEKFGTYSDELDWNNKSSPLHY